MVVEMKVSKVQENKEQRHIAERDNLAQQCSICKRRKPETPTKDCDVRVKLIVKDSEVGWKHKHLFLHTDGHCKMFMPKEVKLI